MEAPRNIRTKAYVVQDKGSPFTLCDVVLDEVRPNEVLVEVWYTGICHTVCISASVIYVFIKLTLCRI